MKCALVGDFNAKTAVLEDFSEPDETFLNVMDEMQKMAYLDITMTTKFYLIIIFPQKDILSVNADQIILDEHFQKSVTLELAKIKILVQKLVMILI